MTDLAFHDRSPAARAAAADPARREPAAVTVIQDSSAIGCAPAPMALRTLATRLRARRAKPHQLPIYGWRDVAAAWLLMVLAMSVVAGWLTLHGPGPGEAQAQAMLNELANTAD
jgi:hypothetical protein